MILGGFWQARVSGQRHSCQGKDSRWYKCGEVERWRGGEVGGGEGGDAGAGAADQRMSIAHTRTCIKFPSPSTSEVQY